jgi:hypothetical protein
LRHPRRRGLFPLTVGELPKLRAVGPHDEPLAVRLRDSLEQRAEVNTIHCPFADNVGE